MADERQLEILGQGVTAWNDWRRKDIRVDLGGAGLNGANLSGADLSSADLSSTTFRGANLSGADLSGADLYQVNLSEADLSAANLRGANLHGADLSGANLREAYLGGATLRRATLCGADLSGVNLREADLSAAILGKADLSMANVRDADLSGANLSRADLGAAILNGADLSGAILRGADLTAAILRKVNLRGADLGSVNLSLTDLYQANLSQADLSRADLRGAHLSGTELEEADFSRASFFATELLDLNLSRCKGLESIAHYGPSSIDIHTLQRSSPLPLVFLRGVGLPDKLIEYLPSLLVQAIQLYSCFISYSSKDEEFVRRLHADLQDNGVRCWFAPEDMKIGAKILDTLDQAIRLRDKILLVLSEASIASDWVEDEVTKGFAEERQRGMTVLFPVRLDDTVFTTNEAWALKLRDNRNIGDFHHWKDHDAYQKTLARLLRDLRVEPT